MYTAKQLPQQPGSVASWAKSNFAGAPADQLLFPLADFLEFPGGVFGFEDGTAGTNPQGPAAGLSALDGDFLFDDLFVFFPPNEGNDGPILKFGDVRGIEQASSLGATDLVSFSAVTDFLSSPGASAAPPFVWEWSSQSSAGFGAASGPDLAAAGAAWSGESHGGGEITQLAGTSAAKGGIPGKPAGGGDGGDGGSGDGVLSEYFSGSADGDAGFDIWLDFKGSGWTTTLQDAFIYTADYFTTVITDDIGGGGRYRGKTIDDLYVSVELKNIDGSGGILGQAGPTAVWTANDLTAVGVMQFDIADATDFYDLGLWDDIVTHELMHVLGFGSLWNYGVHAENGLVVDGWYTGANATDVYGGFIPVEQDGGPGTAGSHWDEGVLGSELMTGYINDSNYLSEFSVMSLADLGYAVSYQDYVDFLIA